MLNNYLQSLDVIADQKHYLEFDSGFLASYQQSFIENIRFLLDIFSPKQQKELLNNKLMFDKTFDAKQEKRYIQSACETTVTSYFAQRFPKSFSYEPRLSKKSNTNAECQFRLLDYTVNIEVKCPTFDRLEAQDLGNRYHINLPVRMDMGLINAITNSLNNITRKQGLLEYVVPHRMDLNLKEYLLSANKKFKGANNESDINILVVCCDGAKTMQEFFNYLFQRGGFFDENPSILAKSDCKLPLKVGQ